MVAEKNEIDEVIDKAGELAQTAQPLRRMKVTSGEISVELEWPAAAGDGPAAPPGPASGAVAAPGAENVEQQAESAPDAGLAHICAPLVGTFYHAPKPGEPPFVRPGDLVEDGQQVGILEAMKLMNPIEADQRGVVAEILVTDGAAVEYGQPLIALTDPDR